MTSSEDARLWFRERCAAGQAEVSRVPLYDIPGWHVTTPWSNLAHRSGKFFSIEGYAVRVCGASPWVADHALIDQPEVGILGFLTKVFGGVRHFLVQAKMEPGNVNGVQLAPTVQATFSNYIRVHKGNVPPYLEYFLEPGRRRVLLDALLPEQAAYFLGKRNRNMVVETNEDFALGDDFCWLTLRQLKDFAREDFAVNMDARSVLSCLSRSDDASAGPGDRTSERASHPSSAEAGPRHSTPDLARWLSAIRERSSIELVHRPLHQLRNWSCDEHELVSGSAQLPVSVIGVSVRTETREVRTWAQPLFSRNAVGLLGLLCRSIEGVVHFLVQATVEPGCRTVVQVSPTVVCHGDWDATSTADRPPLWEWFADPDRSSVRLSVGHSEEGGRFDRFVYRYVVVEVPDAAELDDRETHRWMTLSQIMTFLHRGLVSVEVRNVLACLEHR